MLGTIFVQPIFYPTVTKLFLYVMRYGFCHVGRGVVTCLDNPHPCHRKVTLCRRCKLGLVLGTAFQQGTRASLLHTALVRRLHGLTKVSRATFEAVRQGTISSPRVSSTSVIIRRVGTRGATIGIPIAPIIRGIVHFHSHFPFLGSPSYPSMLGVLITSVFATCSLCLGAFERLKRLPSSIRLRRTFTVTGAAIRGCLRSQDV